MLGAPLFSHGSHFDSALDGCPRSDELLTPSFVDAWVGYHLFVGCAQLD